MSGWAKAREVLLDVTRKHYVRDGLRLDLTAATMEAMLTFGEQCREEGRLAALDEAAAVARGWPHHPAAIEIVRRIEALKDQKS